MRVIRAANVNDALRQAINVFMKERDQFISIAPRGGKETLEYWEPVTTVYTRPWQRVLFSQVRDANPFFHLMEGLWMLRGRQDSDWIAQFSSQIAQFAEDGGYFHGAYGYRWRYHFDHGAYGYRWRYHFEETHPPASSMDQLEDCIKMLTENPDSRRVVLAMWDATHDLGARKRDIPCNTHVYFKLRKGELNMTVCCRSNDLILGCYGANAVHFSMLHEYVAAALGVKMGAYTQISDSWHLYTDNPFFKRLDGGEMMDDLNYYKVGEAYSQTRVVAMVNTPIDSWDRDLELFMRGPLYRDWRDRTIYKDVFFAKVAVPVRDAWDTYKRGDIETALTLCTGIAAPDWRLACQEWLQRRKNRRDQKREDVNAQG